MGWLGPSSNKVTVRATRGKGARMVIQNRDHASLERCKGCSRAGDASAFEFRRFWTPDIPPPRPYGTVIPVPWRHEKPFHSGISMRGTGLLRLGLSTIIRTGPAPWHPLEPALV